jgi:hypothetical protein
MKPSDLEMDKGDDYCVVYVMTIFQLLGYTLLNDRTTVKMWEKIIKVDCKNPLLAFAKKNM